MQSDKLFDGKIIIFAGDFRHIPPVVTNAKTIFDVINCSVKSSPIWQQLKTFALSTTQRSREDEAFSDLLLNIGSNRITSLPVTDGRVKQHLIDLSMIGHVTEVEALIDFVFPREVFTEPDDCCNRAILCTHNNSVKEINALILDRLPGEMSHLYSIDELVSDNADNEHFLGPEILNQLQPRGVPEHALSLKIGCVCMITRNLSFSDQLLNGTKVIVVAISPRIIRVKKPNNDNVFCIPRIIFKTPIDVNSPLEMTRRQFPLQVSYAMTIHKSQGQTIGRVGIDLRSDIFSHGQLYVALGRVTKRDNVRVLITKERLINNAPMVNNVVYSQLLL